MVAGWANARSQFLVSPRVDGIAVFGAPVIAVLLGYICTLVPDDLNTVAIFGGEMTQTTILLRTIIHAHLAIVLVRSHGNPTIFAAHRWRFTLVPAVLFSAMMLSLPFLALVLVVTTYWDVHHSAMQTFGIGRLYDKKGGADVRRDRWVDIGFAQATYTLPFLAGPLLRVSLEVFDKFAIAGVGGFEPWKVASQNTLPAWRTGFLAAECVLVVVWCAVGIIRFRQGTPWSPLKVVMLLSTGGVSTWAWLANPFGEALFIVNVFHAVQYFAIVWWAERGTVVRLFSLERFASKNALALLALVVAGGLYGFWFGAIASRWAPSQAANQFLLAVSNLVALMHFWYDGFIWSVRRGSLAAPGA